MPALLLSLTRPQPFKSFHLLQNDFSMLDRRFEGQLAEACAPHHYNISLLPYGPLAGGTLTDK